MENSTKFITMQTIMFTFCILSLLTVAIFGDFFTMKASSDVLRAIIDNFIHSAIGSMTWLIVILFKRKRNALAVVLFEFMLCAALSSIIDVDHFIMAHSSSLYDATHLMSRPYFHCSTILLVPVVIYLLSLFGRVEWMHTVSWMIFVSIFTHHIRDSIRRGMWFCPFGSTEPVPYWLYVVVLALVPSVIIGYSKHLKEIKPLFKSVHNEFKILILDDGDV
ncbi:transmembrane protein 267 [Ctenocephalides felis]|uniref:transmembrane protein 267 n=1 Tax=Ctenocephalides felis TaxID=7515 RepID=UPI000E6E487D|nr:transmembrane protein 267 [Ctenocephalides felis]